MATYGALETGLTLGAKPSPVHRAQKKLTAVVALSAVFIFFAGRHIESSSRGYTVLDVIEMGERCEDIGPRVCYDQMGTATDKECNTSSDCDAGQTCPHPGKFIGGCVDCKKCGDGNDVGAKTFEYANGGCTAFKDTHCSFCTEIANCERAEHRCTTVTDSECNNCNRHEQFRITDYNQIEVGYFRSHNMATSTYTEFDNTFAAYWGPDCIPCTVCAIGEWQEEPCTQTTDTLCRPCTVCEPTYIEEGGSVTGQYTSKTCDYFSDSECLDCEYCASGKFTNPEAPEGGRCIAGDPYTEGSSPVCLDCKSCSSREFVQSPCVAEGLKFQTDGEGDDAVTYMVTDPDDVHNSGRDTICSACSFCGAPTIESVTAFSGFYFNEEWVDGDPYTFDVHKNGEYVQQDCVRGQPGQFLEAGTDTVCKACPDPYIQSGCRLNEDGDGLYAPPGGAQRMEGCQYWMEQGCGMASYVEGEDLVSVNGVEGSAFEMLGEEGIETANARLTTPGVWNECTECSTTDFSASACNIVSDTICTACANVADIEFCPVGNHHCSDPNDVRCSYDPSEKTDESGQPLPANWCGDSDANGDGFEEAQWCTLDACDAGYYGPQCSYLGMLGDCVAHENGVDGVGKYFLERTAKKGRSWFDEGAAWSGANARDPQDPNTIWFPSVNNRSLQTWTVWCMELCNQYENCTAFSVEDKGSDYISHGDPEQIINPGTQCRLYQETNVTGGADVGRDCYVRWRKNDKTPRQLIHSNQHIMGAFENLSAAEQAEIESLDSNQNMKMWKAVTTEVDEHNCTTATQEWCEVLGKCIVSMEERCIHEATVLKTMSPERLACHMRNFELEVAAALGVNGSNSYSFLTGLSELPTDGEDFDWEEYDDKEEIVAEATKLHTDSGAGEYQHEMRAGDNWFYCLLSHKCINMSSSTFGANESIEIWDPLQDKYLDPYSMTQIAGVLGDVEADQVPIGKPDYFCTDEQTLSLPWGGWDSVFLTKSSVDGQGCDRSRGESWCELDSACVKKWAPEGVSNCAGEENVWQELWAQQAAQLETAGEYLEVLKDQVHQGRFKQSQN